MRRMRFSRRGSSGETCRYNKGMSRFVWVLLSLAPLAAQERVDLAAINQIKNEAFENSKVMDHLSYMTDMYGPRLTGSPEFKQADDWALKRLQDYCLSKRDVEQDRA